MCVFCLDLFFFNIFVLTPGGYWNNVFKKYGSKESKGMDALFQHSNNEHKNKGILKGWRHLGEDNMFKKYWGSGSGYTYI